MSLLGNYSQRGLNYGGTAQHHARRGALSFNNDTNSSKDTKVNSSLIGKKSPDDVDSKWINGDSFQKSVVSKDLKNPLARPVLDWGYETYKETNQFSKDNVNKKQVEKDNPFGDKKTSIPQEELDTKSEPEGYYERREFLSKVYQKVQTLISKGHNESEATRMAYAEMNEDRVAQQKKYNFSA